MQVDIDDLALQIGINVRSQRKKVGLTQSDLSELAGYNGKHSVIANIEAGRALPSIEAVYAMAIAMQCDVSQLLPKKAPLTTI